jgi:hypothetical protein
MMIPRHTKKYVFTMKPKIKFLKNYWSNDNLSQMKDSYENYYKYLDSIKNRLSLNVYEFAKADWHYDPMNHKCPHDSWLESLEIKESSVDGNVRVRSNSINVVLLGAYHDGKISIKYNDVVNYSFERNVAAADSNPNGFFKNGHGDWLIDEFSISDDGFIVHYIEFSNGVNWEIHFQDFKFEWIPF